MTKASSLIKEKEIHVEETKKAPQSENIQASIHRVELAALLFVFRSHIARTGNIDISSIDKLGRSIANTAGFTQVIRTQRAVVLPRRFFAAALCT